MNYEPPIKSFNGRLKHVVFLYLRVFNVPKIKKIQRLFQKISVSSFWLHTDNPEKLNE